jgi:hypothetical protein
MTLFHGFGIFAGAGVFPVFSGDFESIATITVGSGGAASIEFTAIPSTYQHLQIRMISRGNNQENLNPRFNGDTGSNYATRRLRGDSTNAGANASASQTSMFYVGVASPTTASTFMASIIDIFDYGSTTKTKTVRSLGGFDTNSTGEIRLSSGLWNNTSAITSIKLELQSSGQFQQHSTAALYGVKAP